MNLRFLRAAVAFGLGLILLVSTLASHAADAQPASKVYRVGLLGSGSAIASAGLVGALRDGLRQRGWVDGRDILLDIRFAENKSDRLPELADELVRSKVDLIVAAPAAAAVAARKATGTVPIVIASTSNPVSLGLVASLARPGTNVTGVAAGFGDIYDKRLQLLRDAVPHVRRVALLSNPGSATQAESVRSAQAAAQALGLSLQLLEVRKPADFEGAFAAMARERTEALLIVADPLFGTHAVKIAQLVAKYRLPSMHGTRGEFEPGGLIYYGASGPDQMRQAAGYVDKILKGAKPAELAVEQPTKLELVLNLKRARALGLTIPPSIVLRADDVIE